MLTSQAAAPSYDVALIRPLIYSRSAWLTRIMNVCPQRRAASNAASPLSMPSQASWTASSQELPGRLVQLPDVSPGIGAQVRAERCDPASRQARPRQPRANGCRAASDRAAARILGPLILICRISVIILAVT